MARRPGLTLTEVLVTLAILAFGILAILTLFPLAASQMAIAVREDRSAQAAHAADGYFRAYWKSNFVENLGATDMSAVAAFTDPDGAGTMFSAAAAGELSYPVVFDPMGVAARGARISKDWFGDEVGATPGSYVQRRTLETILNTVPASQRNSFAFRLCSQLDGLGYTDDGRPTQNRELRYNWAWIVQRLDSSPISSANATAKLSVIVYDNRPNLYAPAGRDLEKVFQTPTTSPATPGSTQVVLAGVVDVKPGGWVMDATVNESPKIRHANCYQVVSVVDAGGGNTALELQTPILPESAGAFTGKFVIMRGVSGVYPRADLDGN